MISYISQLFYGNNDVKQYINEERQSSASLIVQSNYRRHYERKIYLSKLKKIKKIQRWWRKMLNKKMINLVSKNILDKIIKKCADDLYFRERVQIASKFRKIKTDWEIEWEKARESELAEDRYVIDNMEEASITSYNNLIYKNKIGNDLENVNCINSFKNFDNQKTLDSKFSNILDGNYNKFKRSYSNNDIRINIDFDDDLTAKYRDSYKIFKDVNVNYDDNDDNDDNDKNRYKIDEIGNIIWENKKINNKIYENINNINNINYGIKNYNTFNSNNESNGFNRSYSCGNILDIEAYRRDFKLYIDNDYDPKYLEKYNDNFDFEIDCMDIMRKCVKNLSNNISEIVSKCRKTIDDEILNDKFDIEETKHLFTYI